MTSTARPTKRRRTLTAHHEAGHAVLSAAINDAPRFVTIKPNGAIRGLSRQMMTSHPKVLVQVHLAGYAAEHRFTGRRPKNFTTSLGLSIAALVMPEAKLAEGLALEGRDEYLAAQEVLAMGCPLDVTHVQAEIERFYTITRDGIDALWPAVSLVADALLTSDELDRNTFFAAIGSCDIYAPADAVQKAHGLRT